MKKKQNFLCYILIIIFIGCSNVFAKSTILTCNYTKSYDSLGGSPGISILCEIYSDYSHQCYGEVNNGIANNKSTKYKIENWTKKIKLDWTAKEYVKSNNKCPDYLGIYFGDKIGGLYAGATEEEAKQIASSGFTNGISIYVLPESSIYVNPEKIEKAREKVQQYIDHINKFINEYKIENYKTLSDCKDALDAFQITINNNKSEVANFIVGQLIAENDFLIVNFNGAYSNAINFLNKSYEDLEKKEEEDENIKKDKCEEYTYNQCIGKTDINGNVCIRDVDNKICRKKMACSEYLTESDCPEKSDYGKCKWNSTSNSCEKYDKFICTDYNDKENCPDYDEEGNRCYWNSKEGCSFADKTGDGDLEPIPVSPTSCPAIFSGEFGKFLKQVYSLIKFAVPIIILGFAIIDFIKAVTSGDPAEMKKAATKLVKRLAIGIAIFVLPTLVELILAMAGVDFGTCGIS